MTDTCFDELTASHPDSWQTHKLKAEALHLRQADPDAIVEYQAAERLHADDLEIHQAVGEIFLAENRLSEAKSELDTALRLNPSAPRSLYLLGRLCLSERDPGKAIPYLEAALRFNPALVEARPVLGKAYLKVGKPDLAAAQVSDPLPSTGTEICTICCTRHTAKKESLILRPRRLPLAGTEAQVSVRRSSQDSGCL